jgi:hypothetical protein
MTELVSIKYPVFMWLEFAFGIKSLAYLFVLPAYRQGRLGSLARGEKTGSLAWRQPDFS